jgi:cob(I)alamin adenosyltransferase
MSSKLKIYTRTGDTGQTSLYGGKRVEKHNLQVVAYGTVDELNSALGVVISHLESSDSHHAFLTLIQSDLFIIGSHLAGAPVDLSPIGKRVSELEEFIDRLDKELAPLKNFILPGGSKQSSFSHLARAICRRAEREIIKLSKEQPTVDPRVIIYVNRLSDLLHVFARHCNKQSGIEDVIWKGK